MNGELDFPALCSKFLEIYDAPEGLLPQLTQDMLQQATVSSPEDIANGLHILWPLLRHLTREQCWMEVRDSIQDGAMIRHEIYDHVFGSWLNEAADEYKPSSPDTKPEPTSDSAPSEVQCATTPTRHPEPRPIPATIDHFVRSFHAEGDPITRALPHILAYDFEPGPKRWVRYGDFEFPWSSDHFAVLKQLTLLLGVRMRQHQTFWAVLGPVYDALAYDHPNGFLYEIDRARTSLIDDRIAHGVADLYDYWIALNACIDEDDRLTVMEQLLEYVAKAPAAECEDFFHGLDMDSDPYPRRAPLFTPEETTWPHPDRLWSTIMHKNKQDLSLWLLARAGFYYWHSSRTRHGPSDALAGLGVAIERIPWMIWHDMIPFLPLWAAARSAAAEQRWELSAHYLNRALVDVALYANTLGDDEMQVLEEERFDVQFVGELVSRLKDDIDTRRIPLLQCLQLAAKMCRAGGLDEWTQLRRTLDDLARRLKVATETDTLRHALGVQVLRRLEVRSWDSLVAAEIAWERQDFNAVGLHFRSAVEHEWRRKIGDLLSRAGATYKDRLTLGSMIKWLLLLTNSIMANSDSRSLLGHELGPSNPLLQRRFLAESANVCNKYLNAATHDGGGLTLDLCQELRRILLEERLLQAWLKAVQVHRR